MSTEQFINHYIELFKANPLLLILLGALFISLLLFFNASSGRKRLQKRFDDLNFKSIDEVEEEVERLKKEGESVVKNTEYLRISYGEKKRIYDKLVSEINNLESEEIAKEVGLYDPVFDYETSEEFKEKILAVRKSQKLMISSKTAMLCNTTWTVENSKAKGQAMVNRQIKLGLRAFNNEADAAISNVRWNNYEAMKARIIKSSDAISNLLKSQQINFVGKYILLKLEELRLTHQYREKLKEERDHAAELRRLAREEKQLLADEANARKDEKKFQTLLDKATAKAQASVGSELEKLQEEINKLNDLLSEATSRAERAKSMAEQTKAGFIYVISNVGSFGEGVVKIGMTRRLEPMDRVRELGDASVPFTFDLHALVYTENAPSLEKELHNRFADYRVNMVNSRKEFFRVPLHQVKKTLKELKPDIDFYEEIEAQEFKQTLEVLASKDAEKAKPRDQVRELEQQFPESI